MADIGNYKLSIQASKNSRTKLKKDYDAAVKIAKSAEARQQAKELYEVALEHIANKETEARKSMVDSIKDAASAILDSVAGLQKFRLAEAKGGLASARLGLSEKGGGSIEDVLSLVGDRLNSAVDRVGMLSDIPKLLDDWEKTYIKELEADPEYKGDTQKIKEKTASERLIQAKIHEAKQVETFTNEVVSAFAEIVNASEKMSSTITGTAKADRSAAETSLSMRRGDVGGTFKTSEMEYEARTSMLKEKIAADEKSLETAKEKYKVAMSVADTDAKKQAARTTFIAETENKIKDIASDREQIEDAIKKRADDRNAVQSKWLSMEDERYGIQEEMLEHMGASAEQLQAVQMKSVDVARKQYQLEVQTLKELESRNANANDIEEQRIKVMQSQSDLMKKSVDKQRSSMEKLIGTFGDLAGAGGRVIGTLGQMMGGSYQRGKQFDYSFGGSAGKTIQERRTAAGLGTATGTGSDLGPTPGRGFNGRDLSGLNTTQKKLADSTDGLKGSIDNLNKNIKDRGVSPGVSPGGSPGGPDVGKKDKSSPDVGRKPVEVPVTSTKKKVKSSALADELASLFLTDKEAYYEKQQGIAKDVQKKMESDQEKALSKNKSDRERIGGYDAKLKNIKKYQKEVSKLEEEMKKDNESSSDGIIPNMEKEYNFDSDFGSEESKKKKSRVEGLKTRIGDMRKQLPSSGWENSPEELKRKPIDFEKNYMEAVNQKDFGAQSGLLKSAGADAPGGLGSLKDVIREKDAANNQKKADEEARVLAAQTKARKLAEIKAKKDALDSAKADKKKAMLSGDSKAFSSATNRLRELQGKSTPKSRIKSKKSEADIDYSEQKGYIMDELKYGEISQSEASKKISELASSRRPGKSKRTGPVGIGGKDDPEKAAIFGKMKSGEMSQIEGSKKISELAASRRQTKLKTSVRDEPSKVTQLDNTVASNIVDKKAVASGIIDKKPELAFRAKPLEIPLTFKADGDSAFSKFIAEVINGSVVKDAILSLTRTDSQQSGTKPPAQETGRG